MSRALAMQRTIVPAPERKKHLERARMRRAYYQHANCRYWVFEESGCRARSSSSWKRRIATRSILRSKRADQLLDPARVYEEVELS